MDDIKSRYFSRRSFLAAGVVTCTSGLTLNRLGLEESRSDIGSRYSAGNQSVNRDAAENFPDEYVPDKRTHPAEGLKRENIVITDIKVTPLSYVASKGKYLWRVGGLVVWKSDAALVQVFTNKGIIGIGEASPYCGPQEIRKYTETYITPLLKGANVFDVDFITNNQGHNKIAQGAWAGINNAIWDVICKALDKPVYKLLSGDRVASGKVHMYASGGVEHAWYDNG